MFRKTAGGCTIVRCLDLAAWQYISARVFPETAGIRHEEGEDNADDNRAAEEPGQAGRAENEPDDQREHDRDNRGPDQRRQRALGGQADAAIVIRFDLPFEDARLGTELRADFFDHFKRAAGNGEHQQRREQRRADTADKESGEDKRIDDG